MLFRAALLLCVGGAVITFFALGWHRYLTLESLRANEQRLLALQEHSPLLFSVAYVLLFIAVTALSVPGDVPLALGAGALFGLVQGTVLVSFASTLGATLALLATRFLFRDVVQRRFPARLEQINRGLERGGSVYLLSLRLVPAIPFVLINLLFGVTDFPVWRFYWISQLGMLPATLVYVNAGRQLESIRSLSGILSPSVLTSLLLLAALPLVARAAAARLTGTK